MAQLLYRDGTGAQVPVTLFDGSPGPEGSPGPITSPAGTISADAGNNAVLGTDGEVYVNAPADGGLPVGVVTHYGGAIAPPGWFLCDGSPHNSAALTALIGPNTPDLRDRFVRGAGFLTPGMVGGSDSALIALENMPSHDHLVTGNQSADHSHAGTVTSAGSTHVHTGVTAAETVVHTHQRPTKTSGNYSALHTHSVILNEGSGDSGDGSRTDSNPTNSSTKRVVGTAIATTTGHTHTTVAINTLGRSAGHTHTATSSSASVEHTHTVGGGIQSTSHTHAIPAQGDGQPFQTVPRHYVLTYLIKG